MNNPESPKLSFNSEIVRQIYSPNLNEDEFIDKYV